MSDPTQASGLRRLVLLGPAFVAAVAYVDPGNVAANLTAGGQYRFFVMAAERDAEGAGRGFVGAVADAERAVGHHAAA